MASKEEGSTDPNNSREVHPLYSDRIEQWTKSRDCFEGEDRIKAAGTTYLPYTSGHREDGAEASATSDGAKNYEAYKVRAVFPGLSERAIEAAIGVMHHKPPVIELPGALEAFLEGVTSAGESLAMLLRKINTEQLTPGRIGLYLDIPEDPVSETVLPTVCVYSAESILNWDTLDGAQPTFLVLDETSYARDGAVWEIQESTRILESAAGQSGYTVRTKTRDVEAVLDTPAIRGKTLDEIPFVIINSSDILCSPDKPPLLALNNLELAVYRGEADYRQALFMQSQDTLVVIGGSSQESYRVGAEASLKVPINGDAKFIGVDSKGLEEQRQALENDKKEAAYFGGRLLDTTSRQKEAGDTLRVRVKATTSTLNKIAVTGAAGLELLLKKAAIWVGADPGAVKVSPNLDFADDLMPGTELFSYTQAKALGAPISEESLHKLMQDRGLTEKTYEEELTAIEGEDFMGGLDSSDI